MPEHHTRRTISAEYFCRKCNRRTQHRIDDRRKGPCLECIERLENRPKVEGEAMVTLIPVPCTCSARPYPHLGVHGYDPPVERVTLAEYERRKALGHGHVYNGVS